MTVLPRHTLLPVAGLLLMAALGSCSNSPTPDAGPVDAGQLDSGAPPDAGQDAGADSGVDAGAEAGSPCAADGECPSGFCGVTGKGHCCRSRCGSGDAACGAVDCDSTGQCSYPSENVTCGSVGCDAGTLVASACDGRGDCQPLPGAVCPGGLACGPGGLGCLQQCRSSGDCLGGLRCRAGVCVPRQATGYCASADGCASGVCLGNTCCTRACNIADPICGAQACDPQGQCIYVGGAARGDGGSDAGGDVVCGAATARSCAGGQLISPYCDGQGRCAPAAGRTCAQDLACDPNTKTCFPSCSDAGSSSCAPGFVCSTATCCPSFPQNSTVYVDPQVGDDTSCCGAMTVPCQTISHAMQLIADGHSSGVTLKAPPTNYLTPPEHFPIHLGYGVKLVTSGVFDAPLGTVFRVSSFPGEPDGGTVTIEGSDDVNSNTNLQLTLIGFNPVGSNFTQIAVQVGSLDGGATALQLSRVGLYGREAALEVLPGAKVTFGPDYVSAGDSNHYLNNGGIGVPSPNPAFGIRCVGSSAFPSSLAFGPTAGLSLTDFANLKPEPVWYLETWGAGIGLQLGPDCQADLGSAAGFPFDGVGIQAMGNASLTLSGGTFFNCGEGLQLLPDDGGVGPTVNLASSTIYGSTCAGAEVRAGQLTAAGSTFEFGHFGLIVLDGGTANLSGGGNQLGPSGLVCGGQAESGCAADLPGPQLPGADIVNESAAIDLSNNSLYDTGGSTPTIWTCSDGTLQSCSCAGPGCGSLTVPPDGAALIALRPQAFVTTGDTTTQTCPPPVVILLYL